MYVFNRKAVVSKKNLTNLKIEKKFWENSFRSLFKCYFFSGAFCSRKQKYVMITTPFPFSGQTGRHFLASLV